MKILLVEDDADLAQGLLKALQAEGIILYHVTHGSEAIKQLKHFSPDVVVLDLGLPDMDGTQVLERINAGNQPTPTLILTARNAVQEKVKALDLGADDYLEKPFEMAELLARIRVMGRRLNTAKASKITVGQVELDVAAHTLEVCGTEINLPKKEYMTLKVLMEEAGRVKTKDMLENHLYEWGESVGSNAVEVHISNLRKKLPPNFIQTIRGVGYTIKPDPTK